MFSIVHISEGKPISSVNSNFPFSHVAGNVSSMRTEENQQTAGVQFAITALKFYKSKCMSNMNSVCNDCCLANILSSNTYLLCIIFLKTMYCKTLEIV
jgi:hypothetical protein